MLNRFPENVPYFGMPVAYYLVAVRGIQPAFMVQDAERLTG
jgi:hypothetical protein